MNPELAAEGRPWPVTRWLTLIAVVFAVQLACIFGLSDPPPSPPSPAAPVPVLRLAGASWAQFLAATDPTWFALPHRQGFSGLAWMQLPEPQFRPFSYTSAPEYLPLPNEQPGLSFSEFVRSNDFGLAPPPPQLEVALTLPELVPLPLSRERSGLRLEGGLAHRSLLTQFELRSWPSDSLLTNSVVRVLVDAAGRTRSAVLLSPSGSIDADQDALTKAAVARFAPLPAGSPNQPGRPESGLAEAYMVFEWHTLPRSASTPAASAQ